jgi:S-formylglutathione hydrolase FrmB
MKTTLIPKILFCITVFAWSPIFAYQSTISCGKNSGDLPGGYCIDKPADLTNKDIVYYFHGHTGSEKTWQSELNYTAQIRREWTKRKVHPPTVVAISFGPTWVLASKNSSGDSGLFEAFTEQVMPSIEKSLGGLKGRRIVFGESMGGVNTLQLALKSQYFKKAAEICAPMAEYSPFSSPTDIQAVLDKTVEWNYYKDQNPNPVSESVAEEIELAKLFFPTEQDWNTANPLLLARTVNTHKLPKLYISDGQIDQYASYEATEKFVGILKNRDVNLIWRPVWGAHCSIDIKSLAQFLVDR